MDKKDDLKRGRRLAALKPSNILRSLNRSKSRHPNEENAGKSQLTTAGDASVASLGISTGKEKDAVHGHSGDIEPGANKSARVGDNTDEKL
jgi:hypothetical protein